MGFLHTLLQRFRFRFKLLILSHERLHLGLVFCARLIDLVHQNLDLKLLLLHGLLEARYQIFLRLQLVIDVLPIDGKFVNISLQFVLLLTNRLQFFRLLDLLLDQLGFFFRPAGNASLQLLLKRDPLVIKLLLKLLDPI